ncbi:GNAT family N-acetyltransferase [Aminobacter sp. SR38]|jgi:ribosomal protein S18 acetylase RimI-like enzyme|nr:GNAT family N-acetyltransferase [Aminobacter sp. SR38]
MLSCSNETAILEVYFTRRFFNFQPATPQVLDHAFPNIKPSSICCLLLADRLDRDVIRPANLTDASSLAALGLEVWLNTYIRHGVNTFFADYALAHFTAARFEEIMARADQTILVSQNAVGIDGFIQIASGAPAPVPECSDLEIAKLYVQPRHQGSGAGGRLLDAGLRHCVSTGRPNVWLAVNAENQRAMEFYLRKGFAKAGETRFQIDRQSYPNHVLRYDLALVAA